MQDKYSWREIQEADSGEIAKLYGRARTISWKNHQKKLKVFYPSNAFPSISITGDKCAQNCKYCDKYYLKSMEPILTPTKLLKFALGHEAKGGKGFLLSGGHNKDSIVPIEPFLQVLAEIKKTTKLKVNVHTGLIKYGLAEKLAETGIDTVSFDLVTDNQVISEILQSKKISIRLVPAPNAA